MVGVIGQEIQDATMSQKYFKRALQSFRPFGFLYRYRLAPLFLLCFHLLYNIFYGFATLGTT
jgi:hypothetical protein